MKNAEPEKHFNAFSACFDMKAIDERPFMRKITDATGARHIQVFPDATGLRKDIDFLLKQHDEPVGSVSMYAQYLVMKAARERNVPVLLDGQGGDELFSGYWPAYFLMLNGLKRKRDYPGIARHLAGAVLPGGNGDLIKEAFSHFGEYRRRASGTELFAIKEKYRHLLEETGSSSWHREAQSLSPSEYRIAEITKIHLPRLLKWEDRNSMAFSIESRVPFLDVNLIELVLSVPPDMNMKKGWTKYLFRRAMSTRLPNEICWRKDKKGFETPQGAWMCRGPFHDMLAGWAAEKEHPAGEFADIDFEIVRDRLRSGNFNQARLFRLFCLDIWLKNTGKF
jgi:asparagine synthase (glutamine-hydrolysing)